MNNNVKLELRRIVKADRKTVFAAWTQPTFMKKWFAPGAMTVPNASADLRVGGKYSVEMKGEMGGVHVNPTVSGNYQKIIPDELISFTWSWQGDPPSPETLVTVEFKDAAGGTEVILTHERFASDEAKAKHEHGWNGCLDNLTQRIAELK